MLSLISAGRYSMLMPCGGPQLGMRSLVNDFLRREYAKPNLQVLDLFRVLA